MKISRYFMPTLREDPADAEIISHKLMVRAGMIRKIAAGIYDYLPLGLRVLRKVENIVREEMNRAGSIEVLLPSIIPADLWKETGRWDVYGKELLRVKDRHENDFCYGPTHEEAMTDLVRRDVKSYKQLPVILYQIQTKFRDEIRPRFGLMRGREFIMKDAYSFDRDEESAAESYRKMFRAYERIFKRCGLEFRAVEAATGQIGGSSSHEFMVLADSGEDCIVSCQKCGYASNIEKADVLSENITRMDKTMPPTIKVKTPGKRTIDEVSKFLKKEPRDFIKTLIYTVGGNNGEACAVLLRGDYEVNETKLARLLETDQLEMASPEKVKEITNASVGFAGPKGLKCRIVADFSIKGFANGVSGANEDDFHVLNVFEGRDFRVKIYGDIRNVIQGDACPRCAESILSFHRGIEVGHVFRLGTKYSKAMKAVFLDPNGKKKTIVMGTYGIGIARIAAAAIEQRHDDHGIEWPFSIAPFHIIILPLNKNDKKVADTAASMEEELENAGYEVLLDDRDERAGIKFNDADLIGVPLQIVVGSRGLKNGEIEIKIRKDGRKMHVKLDDLKEKLTEIISELKAG
ncbi:MAG: proline--tRNA ligase [bacterium]|nr:MAG: proline--tRNA ligase [bacterium]